MKKAIVSTFLMMGLVAGVAWADLKVGVIDLRQVLQKTPRMEAINKQLTDEFKPREEQIKSLQDKLQKNVEKLERDQAVLSEKEREKLQDKIMADRRELQRRSVAFQEEAAVAQNKAMQELINDIQKIVNQIAKDKGLDLVFQSDGIPYYKSELDITDSVIEKLK